MNYRLVFNGPIKATPGNALRAKVTHILERDDFESLTIVISSGGGETREGLSLYNFLRSLPQPVRTHAVGHVDSMGVSVFLGGSIRTCSSISRFFWHPFSWTFDAPQRLDALVDAQARFDNDVETARRILRERTRLPDEIVDTLYGRGARSLVAGPEQALQWGVVSGIEDLNSQGRAQPRTRLLTVTW